jgi:hypothetical protein
MQKPPAERMIHVHAKNVSEVPAGVVHAFNRARGQEIAVVALKDGTLIVGRDDTVHDLRATPESMAIQAACRYQKDMGLKTPWDLGGATLYTKVRDVGPLAYAEAQWANVTNWTTVNRIAGSRAVPPTEAADAPNRDLFGSVAAKPYNQPGSAIKVIHLGSFANKAQHVWRDKLAATAHPEDILYNGIK